MQFWTPELRFDGQVVMKERNILAKSQSLKYQREVMRAIEGRREEGGRERERERSKSRGTRDEHEENSLLGR
jgi:hypothetical protein